MHPLTHSTKQVGQYVNRYISIHDSGTGNYLGINVSVRLSRGSKVMDVKRKINLKDNDAGILK